MKSIHIGFILVVSSAVFLSVCFYYDQQRHSDPEFKKKLRERRKKTKKIESTEKKTFKSVDPRHREALIIHEIQVAELLMSRDDIEEAMMHFAHAISVCADPGHLLNCLYQTLPSHCYDLLIEVLLKMYGDRFRIKKIQGSKEDKLNKPSKVPKEKRVPMSWML